MLWHVVSLVVGSVLLISILVDVVNTTLVFTNIGGFITNRLSNVLWRVLPKKNSAADYVGPVILLTIVISWLLLSWLAWWLVFNSTPEAVVNSQTREPATLFERFYFVGFNIFTLGIGDFVPGRGVWQLLTILSTGQGFFVMTLAITYVLPVISSVTERRQLASQLYFWGKTPAEMVVRHWDGHSFALLEDRLLNVLPELSLLEQRNFTYPVLHYFIESDRRVAIAPNIVTLDEALTLLEHALQVHPGISAVVVSDVQKVIFEYLTALQEQYLDGTLECLPVLSVKPLQDAKLSTMSQAEFEERLASLTERRKLLHAMLSHNSQESQPDGIYLD